MGESGETFGGRKADPVHGDFRTLSIGWGSLSVILNRIVDLNGRWIADRKIEGGRLVGRLLDSFR